MTTRIPNLNVPICPECGEHDTIVFRATRTTEQSLAGFDSRGMPEYLPDEHELDSGTASWVCRACWELVGLADIQHASTARPHHHKED